MEGIKRSGNIRNWEALMEFDWGFFGGEWISMIEWTVLKTLDKSINAPKVYSFFLKAL